MRRFAVINQEGNDCILCNGKTVVARLAGCSVGTIDYHLKRGNGFKVKGWLIYEVNNEMKQAVRNHKTGF